MVYLAIGCGWLIAAALVVAACRIAAVGDGDCSSGLGLRKPLRSPSWQYEE
jgi:hypothetical protein